MNTLLCENSIKYYTDNIRYRHVYRQLFVILSYFLIDNLTIKLF